jgi:hypothetical protein
MDCERGNKIIKEKKGEKLKRKQNPVIFANLENEKAKK